MLAMYTRRLALPARSFFLFGPRGTGKTTWLRACLPLVRTERATAARIDLLETLGFHELRARIAYSGCGGDMAYYRTPSGSEVDFIWTR